VHIFVQVEFVLIARGLIMRVACRSPLLSEDGVDLIASE
jgi:hypothetical protein